MNHYVAHLKPIRYYKSTIILLKIIKKETINISKKSIKLETGTEHRYGRGRNEVSTVFF